MDNPGRRDVKPDVVVDGDAPGGRGGRRDDGNAHRGRWRRNGMPRQSRKQPEGEEECSDRPAEEPGCGSRMSVVFHLVKRGFHRGLSESQAEGDTIFESFLGRGGFWGRKGLQGRKGQRAVLYVPFIPITVGVIEIWSKMRAESPAM